MSELFIAHSAKGTSWKNHKYISKKNGNYIYKVPSEIPTSDSDKEPSSTKNSADYDPNMTYEEKNEYYDWVKAQYLKEAERLDAIAKKETNPEDKVETEDMAQNYRYMADAVEFDRHQDLKRTKRHAPSPTRSVVQHSDGLYLVHHGILGQKWGRKNGPPYPLDFNKLSAEEREKAKADSIRDGDIKTAQKNKSYYTRNELEEVINRFNTNQRLAELNAKQVKTGMDKVDAITKKIGTISNLTQNVSNFVQNGTNLYNNVAKVTNSFGLTDAKLIGEKKPKTSYKEKDLEKILRNIDNYSDEDVKNIKQRADNIDQLRKKKFRSNNKDDDD